MDIDLVVTWVDGDDPNHHAKREYYAKEAKRFNKSAGDSTSQLRFQQDGELKILLRSIRKYAGWIRRVWIVTDNQVPEFLRRESWPEVTIIDHLHIFRGYEGCLPTFCSSAIESMIWRIDGLAEHFISTNDDMFFCSSVEPGDFFAADGTPVLRGRIIDIKESMKFNGHEKRTINSAKLLGSPKKVFFPAHFHRPQRRSQCEENFERFKPEFLKNIAYRFRSPKQFWPIGLHLNEWMLRGVPVTPARDCISFSGDFCRTATQEQVEQRLTQLKLGNFKLACINDLRSLLGKSPQVRPVLDEVIS